MGTFLDLIKEEFTHGCEFQYFRYPKCAWSSALKKLKEVGISTISSYIPWIWHEPEEGMLDFEGKTHERRDLHHFLSLLQSYGFSFIPRPGPYIYAEFVGFGVPLWLRERHPEILIRHNKNQQTNEIALLHPTFLKYVRTWVERVSDVLLQHAEEGLRILAVQLDNETGLPQFSISHVFTDYNSHTLNHFIDWLKKHYTLDKLNRLLNMNLETYNDVSIPTLKSSFQLKHMWYDFVEDYLVEYLKELRAIYDEALNNRYEYFLNVPYIGSWPDSHTKKLSVASVGFDIYTKFTSGDHLDDFPFTSSFVANYFLALNRTGITFSPEMQAGWFDPITKVSNDQTMFLGAISYLFNTRYISWYMSHDCIEADGTPWVWNSFLDLNGNETQRFKVLKEMNTLTSQTDVYVRDSNLLRDDIAILTYPFYGREFFEGAFAGDIKARLVNTQAILGLSGLYGILIDSNVIPDVKILTNTPLEELKKYRALFFISLGYLDLESCKKLFNYVMSGGTLIVFGLPFHQLLSESDETDCPLMSNLKWKLKAKIPVGFLSKLGLATLRYKLRRKKISHKQSLHTIDSYSALYELQKNLKDLMIDLNVSDDKFQGELLATQFIEPVGEPFVMMNGKTVGFRKKIGKGILIFVGTFIGIAYNSLNYFLNRDELLSQRQFVYNYILKELSLEPSLLYDSGIEVILRKGTNYYLLGLVNRNRTKRSRIILSKQFSNYVSLKSLYHYKQTKVGLYDDEIRLLLEGNDLSVLLLEKQ